MTLLAPGNMLLAALVVLPILIILYMLKLRRRPVRVSTIAFWTRSPEDAQANTPFQAPRPSWLLLLHLLILACLLIAVGRPAIRDSFRSAQRTFIIIDTSASMSSLDPGDERNRLDRAKDLAKQQAAQILRSGGLLAGFSGSAKQVAVISSAYDAQLAGPFTSSLSLVEAAIDQIKPTDQPGGLHNAFELARVTISGSNEDQSARDGAIVLFTDGVADVSRIARPAEQTTTDARGELANNSVDTPDTSRLIAVQRLRSPLPLQVITVPDAVQAPTSNRGVTLLAAQRPSRSSPGTLQLFVQVASNTVLHPGATGNDDVPVTVTLNDQVVARRIVSVTGPAPPITPVQAPQQSLGVPAPDTPLTANNVTTDNKTSTNIAPTGLATSTIELNNVGAGLLTVTIDLVDSLASDNSVSILLDSAIQPAVLVVQPERGLSAAHVLLTDVLAELDTRKVEQVNAAQFAADPAILSGFDIVIFDGVAPVSLAPISSITFGGMPPGGRCTLYTPDVNDGSTARFFWNRSHPLLRNITLDSLVIADGSYFACIAPTSDALPQEDIVNTRNGPLLTAFTRAGNRHIASSFTLARTNWPLQPSFAVFLADAIAFLTQRSDESAGRMFTTTQAAAIRMLPSGSQLNGPSSVTLPTLAQSSTQAASDVLAGIIPIAGVYNITPPPLPASKSDRAIAINVLDRTETLLTSVLAPGRTDGKGNSLQASNANDGDILAEFWPLAVAIALVLLTIEWFVYGRGVAA